MDQSIAKQALLTVWVKGWGLPPKRGLAFTGVIPRTGERLLGKMEGFQRYRKGQPIVLPRDWKLRRVTPWRTDGERGINQPGVRVVLATGLSTTYRQSSSR